LEDGDQFVFQATGDVLLAPEPRVGQEIAGPDARPQRSLQHLPEHLVLAVFARPAHVARRGTALVPERFVFGLVDGPLLAGHDLGLQREESLFRCQA